MSRKRGNGEGSISRRKGGGWMGQYTVYTEKGKKRKTIYGKTRAEVSEKLAKAIAERDGGIMVDDENLTLSKYLERWFEDSVRGSVRNSTFDSYQRQLRRYVESGSGKIGDLKLRKVTPSRIQRLYREMQDRGLSARTVQYTHAILHRALKQAVRWEMVDRNVCEVVDVPRVRREEMYPLDAMQARHLLDTVERSGVDGGPDRMQAFYVLAIHSGMRPSEMLALRWDDVDLDSKNPHLRVSRALSGGEFTEPKTKKSRRRITLTTGSVSALKMHRKRQREERMALAGLWKDYNLIFPSSVGTPMDHRNLVRGFKLLLKKSGLPDIRLYDLRHTCATLLLSSNVHPKYVQELLGHASITLTLDAYSHILPSMDGGTADAIDEALG